jgi:hypothetical protein
MAPASFAMPRRTRNCWGISHVAEVLDRLWGRGQVGKGGEQRHDRHETRRSPIRNLSSHRAPFRVRGLPGFSFLVDQHGAGRYSFEVALMRLRELRRALS